QAGAVQHRYTLVSEHSALNRSFRVWGNSTDCSAGSVGSMCNVGRSGWISQAGTCACILALAVWSCSLEQPVKSADPPAAPATVTNPAAEAASQAEMKKYSETLTGADVSFEMIPIPGGEFVMGSPDGEADRGDDEAPQHKVTIAPFWMGKCEVTWDEYDIFSY